MFSLHTLTTCGAAALFALPMLAWAAESPSKKVCLMWMGKSTIATQTAKGFLDEMQAKGQGISVESQINLGKDEGPGVYDKMQASMDAVIFLRSDGAQYMAKHAPKCPGFFGGCNNPVDLGVVKALEKPSGNLTGTTYYNYIPAIKTLEQQAQAVAQIVQGLGQIDQVTQQNAASAEETSAATQELAKQSVTLKTILTG